MEPLIRIELSEEGEMRTHVAASATNGISSAKHYSFLSMFLIPNRLRFMSLRKVFLVNRGPKSFCKRICKPEVRRRVRHIVNPAGSALVVARIQHAVIRRKGR